MTLQIAEHVTWKNLESGVVLLDLNSSRYYTLNETASFIFRNITEGYDEEKILMLMLEEYDCDEEVCKADIQKQLDFLKSEKLIIIGD